MRRKKRNHIGLNIMIIILTLMSIVGVGYSYLSGVLKINGQISGELINDFIVLPGSNPNLVVTSAILNNSWQEGNSYFFQYNFNVKNVGQTSVDIFTLTINFLNNIKTASIPNYEYNISNKTLAVTNNNYTIAPNQTLNISITISSKSSTEKVESLKTEIAAGHQVSLSQFNVNFSIANSWGNYTYQYNVTLTNKTGIKVNAWQLDITLPSGTTFVSGWSGVYSFNNQILTIKNESYNGRLNNNASITIGLQLSTNISNYIPNNIIVTVR